MGFFLFLISFFLAEGRSQTAGPGWRETGPTSRRRPGSCRERGFIRNPAEPTAAPALGSPPPWPPTSTRAGHRLPLAGAGSASGEAAVAELHRGVCFILLIHPAHEPSTTAEPSGRWHFGGGGLTHLICAFPSFFFFFSFFSSRFFFLLPEKRTRSGIAFILARREPGRGGGENTNSVRVPL